MAHRLAPEAETDLDHIWSYIAKESGNSEIARRQIDSIVTRFVLLSSYPNLGRRRDGDLHPGLRSFPVGEYVIIYRIEGADVAILHVAQGRRDLGALFDL